MCSLCEGSAEEPTELDLLRQLYQDGQFLEAYVDQYTGLGLSDQLDIYNNVRNAELWLWANNGALRCPRFALFVAGLVERMWRLHRRSEEFLEDMMRDDINDNWGSW